MKKILILSLALAGLSSCSSDDNDNTQSSQAVTGTLSIKYDNQTYAIANPVITMDGSYLHHNVTMDGNVYFEGTNEVRYAVHIGLEQQSSLSVTACDLTVREEEAIGVYSIKNYHGFVNGEAVAGWSQSGTTSNISLSAGQKPRVNLPEALFLMVAL